MVEGTTYAIFSPIWGILLDRGLSPYMTLLIGCLGVIIGFCLLGPLTFIPIVSTNIFIVATGLIIQGSWYQSFTSLMADLRRDIVIRVSIFIRFL